MRSRVLRVKDYRAIDISHLIAPIQVDEEQIQREIQRLTNTYVRWQDGDKVAAGDMAVCDLRSQIARFDRENVKFVAGSGMLNKELEQSVLGMRTGETRGVALPDGTVDMTLVSVMNRICPEPSNEMVEALGLGGIHTLEEYRVHLVREQRRGKIQEAMYAPLRYLVRQVIDQSEFVLYQEDWLRAVEMRLEFSRALAKEEGFVLEEMTSKEFEGRIPVKTYDGLGLV